MTLGIDAKAKQLKAAGVDVVSFGVGEPDFDTPRHIIEAAIKAMSEGQTRYTPSSGILKLREAICQKLERRNGLSYTPEQIVVSNGAKHSLHNAFFAILNEGDEVIVPAPYWTSYPELVKMSGGVPVIIKGKSPNLDAKTLQQAITPRTRALVLNSPGNPCGNVYSKHELEQIAEVAIKHNIIVVSDEIYEDFIYDGENTPSIAALSEEIKQRTIVVNGVSKTYAMTGWRIGYLACCTQLAKAITNWQSHATSNPNSIAQAAAVAAISGDQSCVKTMIAQFKQRRDYMFNKLNSIKGIKCELPKGAFYIMADITGPIGKSLNGKTIQNSMDFSTMLM
ncbi:MAG: pyridoxal phosphate-dependent aminotransferase, partial [Alcaligenaceae bacterium]|nr:pyridoxal phosphate-dependent aminotransferase [Alcaligenaceae bacterium]